MCLVKGKYACGHKAPTIEARKCEKPKSVIHYLRKALGVSTKGCQNVLPDYYKQHKSCSSCHRRKKEARRARKSAAPQGQSTANTPDYYHSNAYQQDSFANEAQGQNDPWGATLENMMRRGDRIVPPPPGGMFEAPRQAPAPVRSNRFTEWPAISKNHQIPGGRHTMGSVPRGQTDAFHFAQGLKSMGDAVHKHLRPTETDVSFGCVTAQKQTQKGRDEAAAARRMSKSHTRTRRRR